MGNELLLVMVEWWRKRGVRVAVCVRRVCRTRKAKRGERVMGDARSQSRSEFVPVSCSCVPACVLVVSRKGKREGERKSKGGCKEGKERAKGKWFSCSLLSSTPSRLPSTPLAQSAAGGLLFLFQEKRSVVFLSRCTPRNQGQAARGSSKGNTVLS